MVQLFHTCTLKTSCPPCSHFPLPWPACPPEALVAAELPGVSAWHSYPCSQPRCGPHKSKGMMNNTAQAPFMTPSALLQCCQQLI